MSKTSTRTFQDAQDDLARALPGYESRSQQQALAQSIEHAMQVGEHLLAEAGTGTGKSLGYLIPAVQSGKRVVVSTATKALQDQIAGKDLPFLAEHLEETFTHAILKGRSNYACLAKVADPDVVADNEAQPMVARTIAEADATFGGERDNFPEMTDREWRGFTTTSENCPGKRTCAFGDACFAEKAKAKAQASDVVVVNHALFLTDLAVRMESDGYGSMLGPYDVAIFDEAHEIEDYAGTIFGSQFTEAGVRQIASEILNWVRRYAPDEDLDSEARDANAGVMMAMADLWRVLVPGRITTASLLAADDQFIEMTNALTALAEFFTIALLNRAHPDMATVAATKFNILRPRVAGLARRFQDVVLGDFEEVVRWVDEERMSNGDTRKVIKSAPISVAKILRKALFDVQVDSSDPDPHRPTAILTSATLSVGGRFEYIAERLGVDRHSSIDVGTPFDYLSQARLYVPRHLPDPTRERAAWQSMVISEQKSLIEASRGRALLLFTSYRAMRDAYEMIAPRLPYNAMMQGQKPVKTLAAEFAADTHSVLFATRSFMTGVDIQGESLSLVVIDKLPFPVPTDPLVAAKTEAIKRRGGNDFGEYTIPVMTLVLKQAFGRLIRHRGDTGVVAILDSRLVNKPYGKKILASLPPAPRVESIAQVQEFFDAIEGRK